MRLYETLRVTTFLFFFSFFFSSFPLDAALVEGTWSFDDDHWFWYIIVSLWTPFPPPPHFDTLLFPRFVPATCYTVEIPVLMRTVKY